MFGKKCSCGNKNIVNKTKIYTMAGDVELLYCEKCWNEYMLEEEKRRETSRIQKQKEIEERERQEYYLKLKREVEIKELEEKAKKYGINVK